MTVIETCLVQGKGGARGWGLISEGVLCPTISWCGSEAVAGALAAHGYPGYTVKRWADDDHSHDATLHTIPPWSSVPWPPRKLTAHDKVIASLVSMTSSPADLALARDVIPEPEPAKSPPLAIIQTRDGKEQVIERSAPERKSLLVRRLLVVTNSPPPRVEPERPPLEHIASGLVIPNAAPVKEDTATENFRVYEPKKLTLAEKMALRKGTNP